MAIWLTWRPFAAFPAMEAWNCWRPPTLPAKLMELLCCWGRGAAETERARRRVATVVKSILIRVIIRELEKKLQVCMMKCG
ncbi:hypothetical protein BC829DRAFT_399905 [Chytridium lagenaria]|nr:hypothetical protein BC829DRAFT_399905 [Chytridium lagenaria]